jgi:hypothetical protein
MRGGGAHDDELVLRHSRLSMCGVPKVGAHGPAPRIRQLRTQRTTMGAAMPAAGFGARGSAVSWGTASVTRASGARVVRKRAAAVLKAPGRRRMDEEGLRGESGEGRLYADEVVC